MRGAWVMAAVVLAAMLPGRGWCAVAFEGPGETMGSEGLRAVESAIREGAIGEAARRVEELLRESRDGLVRLDEGGIVAVRAWARELVEKHPGVREQYRRLFDATAAKAMDAARADGASRAETFYALAQRYAFSSVAAGMYAEAGDRAAAIGDAALAAACWGLAMNEGWKPDEPRATMLATARFLSGEPAGELPGNGAKRYAELAAAAGYRGALAFDAPWHGRDEFVGMARCVPLAVDGTVYLAGPRHVLALREDGKVQWRWASGAAWAKGISTDRTNGRGPVYAAAALVGEGGARVVVVRQARANGRDFSLRALRGEDGKVLWSSEGEGMDNLVFAGNAAIAGRYVYAVAVEFGENGPELVLVGLGVADGRVLLKAGLGRMPELRRGRDEEGWEGFWEQTEPAVAGDVVYVSPNVGTAMAVGRLDGKIRWARRYETGEGTDRLRWRNTAAVCEGSVVFAPGDSKNALGLEARTGRVKWSAPMGALLGAAGKFAVFDGSAVSAVDAATGEVRWRFEPQRGKAITGPAAVAGGNVYVPVSDGKVWMLSGETGKAVAGPGKAPALRSMLRMEGARRAMEEAGVLRMVEKNP